MFASRLPAQIDPSPLARLIAAARQQARAGGAELLDLTESNPTRAGIVYPEREILAGFNDARALVYDPESLGLAEAREQIAELEGVTPDRVILTASTSEAYSWLFKLLCDPGDEILVPRPSYPLFEHLAALESVVVKQYPLLYFRGWFVDMHALEQQVTERTKAIVVVNPNNPTGSYLKRHESSEIASICARRNIALISDEVFRDYPLAEDPERAESITKRRYQPLAFSLNGLSKQVGLPQMKLGWIVVTGDDWQRRTALERLEIIGDTFLSVGTPVQYALPALLGVRERVQSQIMERLHANLTWLREQVRGTVVSLLKVEGGWSATLRVPNTRSEEDWVAALLVQDRVLVQPGYFYDFDAEGYLVISLLTPPEVVQEAVGRLLTRIRA